VAESPAHSNSVVPAGDAALQKAALQKTDTTIAKFKRWTGYGLETLAGAALVGAGSYDLVTGAHLLSTIPIADWQAIVLGAPLLGVGQSMVQTVRRIFGQAGV
jgi:hypothetical protein